MWERPGTITLVVGVPGARPVYVILEGHSQGLRIAKHRAPDGCSKVGASGCMGGLQHAKTIAGSSISDEDPGQETPSMGVMTWVWRAQELHPGRGDAAPEHAPQRQRRLPPGCRARHRCECSSIAVSAPLAPQAVWHTECPPAVTAPQAPRRCAFIDMLP